MIETLVEEASMVGAAESRRSEAPQSFGWRFVDNGLRIEHPTASAASQADGTQVVAQKLPGRVTSAKVRQKPAEEVKPKAKWLGHVTSVSEDGFAATFVSDAGDRKAIVAEFDIEEVSKDDRPLLRVGAQLVWAIFTERRRGTIENGSVLYIRRIPAPSREAVALTQKKLDDWFGALE